MPDIMWGVVGTLMTLAIVAGVFILGWKANDIYRAKMVKAEARVLSEKEKKRQEEDAEAFRQLLDYSAEVAYGMKTEKFNG